jgi:23S rRNA (pseudouridine1915-N3)-methyltransferase
MRLLLLFAGKTRNPAWHESLEDYRRRVDRYCRCEIREIREEKPGRSEAPADFCRRQAPRLLSEFNREPGIKLLLDERGPARTSREFAVFLEKLLAAGQRNLVFLCGGAFGYDPSLRRAADHLVALSPLTFPHELARVLLLEQLYRALTIIRNEPYHY